jgi:cyanophycinase-like exopeptidase
VAWLLASTAFGAADSADSFDYYRSGDPVDAKPVVEGGVMLMGGGEEVAPAFQWMLRRAGYGNVVVLRASFADEYHAVFKSMGPMASIETFVFKSREASFDRFLLSRLAKAELIFISGGDQAKYIEFWRHTPVDELINARVKSRSVVLGGTSAGLAILGGRYFSARFGSVYSDEVLKNPLDR